jgi:hypothetical protein
MLVNRLSGRFGQLFWSLPAFQAEFLRGKIMPNDVAKSCDCRDRIGEARWISNSQGINLTPATRAHVVDIEVLPHYRSWPITVLD